MEADTFVSSPPPSEKGNKHSSVGVGESKDPERTASQLSSTSGSKHSKDASSTNALLRLQRQKGLNCGFFKRAVQALPDLQGKRNLATSAFFKNGLQPPPPFLNGQVCCATNRFWAWAPAQSPPRLAKPLRKQLYF